MGKCKIHIFYKFTDGPWGGGNQFLKALRNSFISLGVWEEIPENADVILFNSHSFLDLKTISRLFRLLCSKKPRALVHRIDGPVFCVRGKDFALDKLIFEFNGFLADGTVFQSKWSQSECVRLGFKPRGTETVIANAPDGGIFYPRVDHPPITGRKVRIIATSWSPNIRKGFSFYQYLDEHLDHTRYEMTFIGNSPIRFQHIHYVPPQSSEILAQLLREHDLFITASQNDPCSNSLLEAVGCGLPVVALNSGGHPELIGDGGRLFNDTSDILAAIDVVSANLEQYRANILKTSMNSVSEAYYRYCCGISSATTRRLPVFVFARMLFGVLFYRLRNIL